MKKILIILFLLLVVTPNFSDNANYEEKMDIVSKGIFYAGMGQMISNYLGNESIEGFYAYKMIYGILKVMNTEIGSWDYSNVYVTEMQELLITSMATLKNVVYYRKTKNNEKLIIATKLLKIQVNTLTTMMQDLPYK